MMALLANVNKQKGKAYDPVDFHPYKERQFVKTGFSKETYTSLLTAFVKPKNRLCHDPISKQGERT